MNYNGEEIPEKIIDAIERYVVDKIKPGDFLSAVLRNDLKESIGQADEEMEKLLPTIVRYVYNNIPHTCWGSSKEFDQWLAKRETING